MKPKGKGWSLLGNAGVDSGQLLLTDPCYLVGFENNEAPGHPVYRDTVTGNHYRFYYNEARSDEIGSIPSYEATVPGTNLTCNQMIAAKRMVALPHEYPKDYSYRGCCIATNSKERGGEVGSGRSGVAFSSGYGDGCYEVWGRKNSDGRIVEVRIIME